MRALALGVSIYLLLAGGIPVSAQTVSLYCSNPDLTYSYFIDVDVSGGNVTVTMDVPNRPSYRAKATISNTQVSWMVGPGTDWESGSINRITNEYRACWKDEGCKMRAFQFASSVKPQW